MGCFLKVPKSDEWRGVRQKFSEWGLCPVKKIFAVTTLPVADFGSFYQAK